MLLSIFERVEDEAGDFAAVGAADIDDVGKISESEKVFQDTLNE